MSADSLYEKSEYASNGDGRLYVPVGNPHFHSDEHGLLVKCYHKAKVNPVVTFVLGTLVSFPIEHYLYEKVWPFTVITKWLSL